MLLISVLRPSFVVMTAFDISVFRFDQVWFSTLTSMNSQSLVDVINLSD